ncbi:hypothetical protein F4808DRAFT_139961 [Astrocystis sublimbata]|nr:hypothetical protein F4808DRAFT_139961 [Astrocystis sublimbata]
MAPPTQKIGAHYKGAHAPRANDIQMPLLQARGYRRQHSCPIQSQSRLICMQGAYAFVCSTPNIRGRGRHVPERYWSEQTKRAKGIRNLWEEAWEGSLCGTSSDRSLIQGFFFFFLSFFLSFLLFRPSLLSSSIHVFAWPSRKEEALAPRRSNRRGTDLHGEYIKRQKVGSYVFRNRATDGRLGRPHWGGLPLGSLPIYIHTYIHTYIQCRARPHCLSVCMSVYLSLSLKRSRIKVVMSAPSAKYLPLPVAPCCCKLALDGQVNTAWEMHVAKLGNVG